MTATTAQIREWAQTQDLLIVPERGPLPVYIVEAYRKAHPDEYPAVLETATLHFDAATHEPTVEEPTLAELIASLVQGDTVSIDYEMEAPQGRIAVGIVSDVYMDNDIPTIAGVTLLDEDGDPTVTDLQIIERLADKHPVDIGATIVVRCTVADVKNLDGTWQIFVTTETGEPLVLGAADIWTGEEEAA